ncbi:MAG: hypothetical protein M1818_000318 [Claussenomyces sp. TS43310]|nr:MAG: hypothetical protein M1818_000318 [Claussenomyces sp. TS43310]
MNEDERYRTSTQYRLWSYTPEDLASQRAATTRTATERVRAAIQRIRASKASANGKDGEGVEDGSNDKPVSLPLQTEVNCLTPEEELKLVAFYCKQILDLADHLKVPTDVKATAAQYLKRFYITNSIMTYHPTDILKTALFFATKTENHYYRLTKFADAIGKTKAEDVLASEFLLTQGLRFTFDVRHPYRALEGATMELQALANGTTPALPGGSAIPPSEQPKNMSKRVREAHGKAREYLKTSALLTDVYFHYTPSQIMFASLLIADEELTMWYMSVKLQDTSMREKVTDTLQSCAEMLKSVPPSSQPSPAEIIVLKGLAKKLQKCRNPEKMDLVAINKAAKREGAEEGLDEKIVKKRKLERERVEREGHDLFGPELKRSS